MDENTNEKKHKGKIGKIFSIIGRTLGIMIIIFILIVLGRMLIYKKNDVFGIRFYQIMSGSMEPTIHISDLIITSETNDLSKNDIIAFEHGGSITVHRIVDIIEDNGDRKVYQTKGDNNNANDPYTVSSENIKGKYVFDIPGAGNILQWIQKNLIIIISAIIIIVLIITVLKMIL